MRYRLRTLLILLAVVPPLLWLGWTNYEAWRAEQEQQAELLRIKLDILIWMDVTVNGKTSLARLLSWPLHRSNTILERGYAEESQR